MNEYKARQIEKEGYNLHLTNVTGYMSEVNQNPVKKFILRNGGKEEIQIMRTRKNIAKEMLQYNQFQNKNISAQFYQKIEGMMPT